MLHCNVDISLLLPDDTTDVEARFERAARVVSWTARPVAKVGAVTGALAITPSGRDITARGEGVLATQLSGADLKRRLIEAFRVEFPYAHTVVVEPLCVRAPE